jgi:hypothetical protein
MKNIKSTPQQIKRLLGFYYLGNTTGSSKRQTALKGLKSALVDALLAPGQPGKNISNP